MHNLFGKWEGLALKHTGWMTVVASTIKDRLRKVLMLEKIDLSNWRSPGDKLKMCLQNNLKNYRFYSKICRILNHSIPQLS